MAWSLTAGHVDLISVTLMIKRVSIFLTSAPLLCEYRYLFPCSSVAPVMHIHTCQLDSLHNNLPVSDCCILDWISNLDEGLLELNKGKSAQRLFRLTSSMGKQTQKKHILVANPSVRLFFSQSRVHRELCSQQDYARSDWLGQADRPKLLITALCRPSSDWALWLTPIHHQTQTLVTYQLWHG